MTDPQTGRPKSGAGADVAADPQPAVPPQGATAGASAGSGPAAADGYDTAQARYDSRYDDTWSGQGGRTADQGGGNLVASIAKLAWGAALLAAIGMVAVGIMLLVWPTATLTVVAILIGAALIVAGLLRLFDGATAHGESGGTRAADIVIGLLAIVAGLYCLKHHSLTVLVLALVVGVIWIIHGISDLIVAGTATGMPGRGLKAVGGVFSLAAGLVILFWPGITLILLLTILGAWLIFYGLVLGGLAFSLRRNAKASTTPASPAAAAPA